MSRSLPPLTWLRAFECAARHLSFTGAAGEMNITQSAVSQHVRLLETRFSTSLFVRKARGIALTESGRRLMPHVSGAMADLATATEMFDPHHGENVLEIACSSSFARLWLCGHIHQFLDMYPTLNVRIASAIWPDDYPKVESDVQIRYGSVELVGNAAERLFQDTMIAVCHPDVGSEIKIEKGQSNFPLINIMGTENTWGRWSKLTGIKVSSATSLSVDSDELALEMAEKRLGIALCGRFLCQGMLETNRLCTPLEGAMPSDENYYLSMREERRAGDAALAFRSWLFGAIG